MFPTIVPSILVTLLFQVFMYCDSSYDSDSSHYSDFSHSCHYSCCSILQLLARSKATTLERNNPTKHSKTDML